MRDTKMNEYRYEEIQVGQKESFCVTVTQEMMESFLNITGDINPLHNDEAYARSEGHPGRVAYGMLTGAFLSTLAGVYLPGKYSLIHEVRIKFSKPVYIGDTLTVEGMVEEKNDTYSLLFLAVTIRDQQNRKVCKAKMQVGVTR